MKTFCNVTTYPHLELLAAIKLQPLSSFLLRDLVRYVFRTYPSMCILVYSTTFLIVNFKTTQHGVDGTQPLPYSHLDIAASSGPFPGIPSSSPVLALVRYYLPQFF